MSRPQEHLACAMARHHFGPVVGEVVRLLLIRPGSSVPTLCTASESFFNKSYDATKAKDKPLTPGERTRLIRDGVAVLIQHDLCYGIQTILPDSENGANRSSPPTSLFQYHILMENILCRSRLPLYLGFARQRYGSVGEVAMRVLFERGRLTARMMFTAALDSALSKLALTVSDAEACLTDMARCGLLHWSCRRFTSRVQRGRDVPDADSRVGEKRSRPMVDSDDSDDDEEMRSSDSDSEEDGRIVVGRGDARRKVTPPTRDNDSDVWTICYWHLNREFRNDCCVKVALTRVRDDIACRILRIGLHLALDNEDCNHPSEDFETTDIAVEDIQKQLEEEDGSLPASAFWEGVKVLVSQTPSFVHPIPEEAPTKLRFVPGRLIGEARQKTLEELIATRYQPAGRRVFEALTIEGGMEENMLAEKCMLHVKVVRALVYKLYEDQLVGLQEVPRSHDQQRSSNWYYLWHVNLLSAFRNMMEIMFKVSHNLFVRLESLQFDKGNENDIRRARAQEQILMGSILRMDQSIMVLRDFGPLTSSYFPARYTILDGPVGKIKKKR